MQTNDFKSFICRTYENAARLHQNCANNSFRICTYKDHAGKFFRIRTYKKRRGGPVSYG